jgi:large subunit ribosomal protein L29
MKAQQYRDLSLAELERQEADARERMFKLRFQISMGQAEGIRKYRATRKDLARILTVAGEKRRDAAAAGEGGRDG